ncbi:ABC transporter A family member 2 [Platanthera zijinensis]|uniref:ABC transporter A family member 2 n=1 Tax=Platanthera zijinensis TaxID=2320716 RepID=A0AAP0G865_9ASPA
MDPISRRHVWDIIENAKKGRAIVLTTHSMEEADILSDRIAIMAKGRLRCIGTSLRLKSKFGTGYIANISFTGSTSGHIPHTDAELETTHVPKAQHVKLFFKKHLDVEPKEERKSFLTFVIPHDKEKLLPDFFAELQNREDEFGISDIQLGLTTLEEVFMNIAKQAEIESVSAGGNMVMLSLPSGLSVQVPIGSRFVGIPGTVTEENPNGTMVEVYWEQDDSGALCISGHSPEISIPNNVEIPENRSSSMNSRSGAQSVTGFVIHPNQVLH